MPKFLKGSYIYEPTTTIVAAGYITSPNSIINFSGTSRTLSSNDNGKIINCSNTNNITITIPTGLDIGFSCRLVQSNTGIINTSNASGVLITAFNDGHSTLGKGTDLLIFSSNLNEFILKNSISDATNSVSSAFDKANTALSVSQSSFSQANTARTAANTALSVGQSAFAAANTGSSVIAISAFNQANTARDSSNTALSVGQSAFAAANTGSSVVAISAFNQANTARDAANTVSANLTSLINNADPYPQYVITNSITTFANTFTSSIAYVNLESVFPPYTISAYPGTNTTISVQTCNIVNSAISVPLDNFWENWSLGTVANTSTLLISYPLSSIRFTRLTGSNTCQYVVRTYT